jgi:hypothetical protein
MRANWSFLLSVLLIQGAHAQNTTTLARESGNNTSAIRSSSNGNAQPGNVSKLPIRSLLYPGATTTIVARFMPWFGDKGHRDYGYRSDDQKQVDRQVEDMMSRGIDAAVVDWYGPDAEMKNHVTEMLLRSAEERGFKMSVSVDAGSLKECRQGGCDLTQKLVADLRYAMEHFAKSPAYLRFDDRPLVTFFGLENYDIDWGRVAREVPGNPMFLFRNSGGFEHPGADGAFAWLASESAKSGNPYGLEYLEHFYKVAEQHSGKFVMGSAYKGFDDSEAGWGKGRKIDQDCGRTWLRTFEVAAHHFNRNHPLPALIVVTWNDWEEGTEIESGIENCVTVRASVDDKRLRWDAEGPGETLDHFEVFSSQDGEKLTKIADRPAHDHEMKLDEARLTPGKYTFYVKAVAKPSLMNHMSNGVVAEIGAAR